MRDKCLKSLLVLAFSLFLTTFSSTAFAGEPAKGKLNMKKVIFGHIGNSHDFHIFSTLDKEGEEHPVSIPLPVILYSPQKGFSMFMSSKFHHGHEEVDGYKLIDEGKTIVPVDPSVKVYDFSLTRACFINLGNDNRCQKV
jgi:F-type H+-transporting ATPase subunit a